MSALGAYVRALLCGVMLVGFGPRESTWSLILGFVWVALMAFYLWRGDQLSSQESTTDEVSR